MDGLDDVFKMIGHGHRALLLVPQGWNNASQCGRRPTEEHPDFHGKRLYPGMRQLLLQLAHVGASVDLCNQFEIFFRIHMSRRSDVCDSLQLPCVELMKIVRRIRDFTAARF